MICSFLCNGVIFGIHNSFGVLFVFLKEGYKDDPDAATKASSVGSLAVAMTFLLSPISSILVDRYGVRRTAFTGGLIAFLGMVLSSFAVDRVELLYLTYGVMFGGGSSLTYTPSLVILGHYFKKHMGLGTTRRPNKLWTWIEHKIHQNHKRQKNRESLFTF